MSRMIVFLFYKLFLSALVLAGIRRQAVVKIPLPTLGKVPGPSKQVADSKRIIGDDPRPIAIFSLRFPVQQGKSRCAGLPARSAGRVGSSAAGDRVGVLAARRQPMLVPAIAAVPG